MLSPFDFLVLAPSRPRAESSLPTLVDQKYPREPVVARGSYVLVDDFGSQYAHESLRNN